MRRSHMALLGLMTAASMAVVPATQASAAPAAAAHHSTITRTYFFRTHLPPAQCLALRRSVHNTKANCSPASALHLKLVRTDAGDSYGIGWLESCAEFINKQAACSTNAWWVKDTFGVTVNGTDAWNNVHTCTSNGTTWTWCGDADNGTGHLSEGFNYGGSSGTSDYARITINGQGSITGMTGNLLSKQATCGGTWAANCPYPGFG
jgi:hypothetical protein